MNSTTVTASGTVTVRLSSARTLLQYTSGIVPIVPGLDKFTHLLTDWTKYLAPDITDILPIQAGTFMYIVGVVEIIAAILVFIRPKLGSRIVGL